MEEYKDKLIMMDDTLVAVITVMRDLRRDISEILETIENQEDDLK